MLESIFDQSVMSSGFHDTRALPLCQAVDVFASLLCSFRFSLWERTMYVLCSTICCIPPLTLSLTIIIKCHQMSQKTRVSICKMCFRAPLKRAVRNLVATTRLTSMSTRPSLQQRMRIGSGTRGHDGGIQTNQCPYLLVRTYGAISIDKRLCQTGRLSFTSVTQLSPSPRRARVSASRYLEKSPPNAAKFTFLQEMFKDAGKTVFVAILRHPIAILRKRFFGFGGKIRHYRTKEQLLKALDDKLGCWYVRDEVW